VFTERSIKINTDTSINLSLMQESAIPHASESRRMIEGVALLEAANPSPTNDQES